MDRTTNDLLRSAYQIAKREGENTNWKTFRDALRKELLVQAGNLPTIKDRQIIFWVTRTAKIYRRIPYLNNEIERIRERRPWWVKIISLFTRPIF